MNVLESALNLVDLNLLRFEIFVLVLIRVSFMIFLMPVVSGDHVITQVKVGLCFFIALAINPWVSIDGIVIQAGTGIIFWLVLKEAMVGIIMGMTGNFLFTHVDVAAEIINREMGLNQAPMIDPMRGENSSAMSLFIINLFTIIFLLSGYHLYFFEIVKDSFDKIPLTTLGWKPEKWMMLFLTLFVESFLFGIRMSAPVFSAILVSLIGMSLASRIMPQMNIWILSIPVKIGLGVLILYYSLPMMFNLFESVFGRLHLYSQWILSNGS